MSDTDNNTNEALTAAGTGYILYRLATGQGLPTSIWIIIGMCLVAVGYYWGERGQREHTQKVMEYTYQASGNDKTASIILGNKMWNCTIGETYSK